MILVDMAFNLGTRLQKFQKMQAALHRSDYVSVAREMVNSRWAQQVRMRALRNVFTMLSGYLAINLEELPKAAS
jgi:lysozyme